MTLAVPLRELDLSRETYFLPVRSRRGNCSYPRVFSSAFWSYKTKEAAPVANIPGKKISPFRDYNLAANYRGDKHPGSMSLYLQIPREWNR